MAVQALQMWRLRTARSPATVMLTHSLRRRLRVEPSGCGPMAAVQLVRRQHVRHHAGSTTRQPATFVTTFGLLSCSLDACFDDRCWPVHGFRPSEAVFLCTIQEATCARPDKASPIYFAESCDSTNLELLSTNFFGVSFYEPSVAWMRGGNGTSRLMVGPCDVFAATKRSSGRALLILSRIHLLNFEIEVWAIPWRQVRLGWSTSGQSEPE